MITRISQFAFVMLLIAHVALAQEVMQNNGPSLKWRQINTPSFRLIFPQEFDEEAQRVANTLETIHEPETLGDKSPKKISIILRNRHTVSNGFVTLGPRRSEFYTMPPQDNQFIGTNDWLDLLSVHEYRHIAQFQQSKTGLNKVFYYIFGQNTQAGMAFAAVPRWFWEGDATAIETINTQSGRGRIPEFSRVFKTNLLEKGRFNYNKQHLRSFKDYIPDHYKLGYHFVTHLRRRTGDPEIWDKVTASAYGLPIVPFTFSNALKKHTGDYLVDNFNQMMDDVETEFSKQIEDLEPSAFERLTKRTGDAFTDYSYPQQLDDGTIVAYKSGIGDVGQLVRLSAEGNEIGRFINGVTNNTGMLSGSQRKVVWNEYHYHPRWRAKTYSVIKMHDFANGKTLTITEKSRYGGAAISPNGYRIVTTLNTENNQNYLVILDTFSGQEVKRFENADNDFYSMANWSSDGKRIVVLKTNDEGRSVVMIDPEDGAKTTLIEAGTENIGYPVLHGKYLLYNSPYNGIDNIYALDVESNQRYQVTQSKYGAYNANISVDEKHIIYNEHTVNGLDVVKAPLNKDTWIPLGEVQDRNINYYEPLIAQEGHQHILDEVGDQTYRVEKYSKLKNLINVHSWGPYATTDINRAEIGVFSRDVLSTTSINLGYTYDAQEETGYASAGISYQGMFPIVDFEVQKGKRSSDEGTINGEDVVFDWDELGFEGGLRLPLLLTRSKFFTELEVGNYIGYRSITDFDNPVLEGSRLAPINDSLAFFFRDILNEGNLLFNRANINFYMLMKQSQRDINSRFGYSINLELYNTPYGGDFEGRLFAGRLNLYLPSPLQLLGEHVGKHHSLFFRLNRQTRLADLTSNLYYFRNRIPKPRGYSYPSHEKFTSFSANYSLPLWYPDVAVGPFLNFQRIRANGFFDYGQGVGRNYFVEYTATEPRVFFSSLDEIYKSVGVELFVDFNAMRFSPLITLGARYSYLLNTNEANIDFLIVNIGL